MAKVHWLGATYQDVPAVSLPDGDGGESVFYEGGGGTLITIHDDGSSEIRQVPLTSVEQPQSIITKDIFMSEY